MGDAVVINFEGASGLAIELAKSFAVLWLLERVNSLYFKLEGKSLSFSASSRLLLLYFCSFFVLFFFVSVLFFFVPPFAPGAPRTLVKWQRKKRS